MDRILIRGGSRLEGNVPISGAKNAALPIMAASLLCEDPVVLRNIPVVADIEGMERLLCSMGVETHREDNGHTMHLNPTTLRWSEAPYDLVRKMRATFFVLGPLLGRTGHARVSVPGGCAIGSRPVDIHLKALAAIGANIEVEHGYVNAEAPPGGLVGGEVNLDFPSVGATENVLCAAAMAKGTTTIRNAAKEPEITDLANFLIACGAIIDGAGSDTIHIDGVDNLSGCEHSIIRDRIEAGTFMVAAAITGGDVLMEGANIRHNAALVAKLEEAGTVVLSEEEGVRVKGNGIVRPLKETVTLPYPGFPTDLQAQLMVLMAIARGTSVIRETIFENRFMHVSELCRLGADIKIEGNAAVIRGVPHLSGGPVMASDLRASAALVLAGLIAEGTTEILRVYHIDRGYEKIEEKLSALGAEVERQKTTQAELL